MTLNNACAQITDFRSSDCCNIEFKAKVDTTFWSSAPYRGFMLEVISLLMNNKSFSKAFRLQVCKNCCRQYGPKFLPWQLINICFALCESEQKETQEIMSDKGSLILLESMQCHYLIQSHCISLISLVLYFPASQICQKDERQAGAVTDLTFILKCYTMWCIVHEVYSSISILVHHSASVKSRWSSQCHL